MENPIVAGRIATELEVRDSVVVESLASSGTRNRTRRLVNAAVEQEEGGRSAALLER